MKDSDKSIDIGVIAFAVSLSGFVGALLIAHTMIFFAATSVVWLCLIMGWYFAVLKISSIFGERRRSSQDVWSSLFGIVICMGLSGVLAVALISFGHMVFGYCLAKGEPIWGVLWFFGISMCVTGAVAWVAGSGLALMVRAEKEWHGESGSVGCVLWASYSGILVGGFLVPLILIPLAEDIILSWSIAAVNVCVAVGILLTHLKNSANLYRRALAVGLMTALLAVGFSQQNMVQQYFLKKFYFPFTSVDSPLDIITLLPVWNDIERTSSARHKIDIVTIPQEEYYLSSQLISAYSQKYQRYPDAPKFKRLFIDGDLRIESGYEEVYQEYFAHVPVALSNRSPERVLMLGSGDGLLLKEILKYNFVREVTVVVKDQSMVSLARTHPFLLGMNQQSFTDPRVKVVSADPYAYLHNADDVFDAVYIDAPIPNDYNASRMYSREFFAMVKRVLSDTGYAVLEAPGSAVFSPFTRSGRQILLQESDWPMYYHTLRAAGFSTIVPYVSNLEVDNERAIGHVLNLYRSYAQGQELKTSVQNTIEDYVHSLQEGFIYVSNRPVVNRADFTDFGVELHVLNAERFKLALMLEFPVPQEDGEKLVNSVMRPVLPIQDFWYLIRRP